MIKNQRILDLYLNLLEGECLNKTKVAAEYRVSERTVDRDISDLRSFLVQANIQEKIEYSPERNGYVLIDENKDKLTNSEILAVCKILLDSRAFLKDEMSGIIDKLIKQCIPKNNFDKVAELVKNEKFHYIELQHKKSFIHTLWDIGDAIQQHFKIRVNYKRADGSVVERVIKPVGLMFSEFYFYLLGHIENIDKEKCFKNKKDSYPTIYRVDRIESFEVLPEHFCVMYKDKFEEGEFRKRAMFMTGGKLRKIRFKYFGKGLEAVLDKIPTAQVVEKHDDYLVIKAEVFGNGINRWLLGQGEEIEILE